MNFNIIIGGNHSCDFCKKSINDDRKKGCEICGKFYFFCTDCNDDNNKCLKCDYKLKNQSDMFQYKFLDILKNTNPSKINDVDSFNSEIQKIIFAVDRRIFNINEIMMDQDENTPIISAAIYQKFHVCEFLINQYRASVGQVNKFGRTALIEMIRCRGGKWDKKIAELFSETVNYQDKAGKTALMFAAKGAGAFGSKKGSITIASQLINMGADTNIIDRSGHTALYWAMESNKKSKTSNNSEMVKFLRYQMIEQVAVKEFHKNYSYEFDNSVLNFQKNTP